MRKKLLVLCMAAVLSLALLAGCDSADPNHPYDHEPAPANNAETEETEETAAALFFEV